MAAALELEAGERGRCSGVERLQRLHELWAGRIVTAQLDNGA
jgi:hypothetical protein